MEKTREIGGDPGAMRALAHPVRLAVLELLERAGPLTATEAGQALDEAPGNMSWHLGVLARHGFIVEAPGGRGRRRPWTVAAAATRVRAAPGPDSAAADALLRMVVERSFRRVLAWLGTRNTAGRTGGTSGSDDPGDRWRDASALGDWTLHLTPAEARRLRIDLYALFEQYSDRLLDPAARPPGTEPVSAFLALYPSAPDVTTADRR